MCLACDATRTGSEPELARALGDLAGHPYLVAWRGGVLAREDLKLFAAEHGRLVGATARATKRVVRAAPDLAGMVLAGARAQADADAARWEAFARATGWIDGAPRPRALASTAATARAIADSARGDLATALVALWAVAAAERAATPSFPSTLFKHYGIDGAGAVWFDRRLGAPAIPLLRAAHAAGAGGGAPPAAEAMAIVAALGHFYDALDARRA